MKTITGQASRGRSGAVHIELEFAIGELAIREILLDGELPCGRYRVNELLLRGTGRGQRQERDKSVRPRLDDCAVIPSRAVERSIAFAAYAPGIGRISINLNAHTWTTHRHRVPCSNSLRLLVQGPAEDGHARWAVGQAR